MYESHGPKSVPPEHLLKGMLLTALYSVRSERGQGQGQGHLAFGEGTGQVSKRAPFGRFSTDLLARAQ